MDLQSLIKNANFDHSRKVSQISGMMARKAGYSEAESRIIEQAGLYHDVGKSALPIEILNKPGALTPSEYEIIKTHTILGCKQITEAVQILSVAALVAQQHHEKADSTGYYHLSCKETHPYARLVSCADVMDALYSRRAYKNSWDIAKIREYFTAQSGKQFDPEMVNVLFSIMDDVLKLYH